MIRLKIRSQAARLKRSKGNAGGSSDEEYEYENDMPFQVGLVFAHFVTNFGNGHGKFKCICTFVNRLRFMHCSEF